MTLKTEIIISLCLAALVSCGPRKGGNKTQDPVQRPFPRVEVPALITEEGERLVWGTVHYWDSYLNPSMAVDDTLNGVSLDGLEKEVGTYSTLLNMIPLKDGKAAIKQLWDGLEAFQKAREQSLVMKHLAELVEKYLYDPNSPMRNEDLFLPFLEGLSESRFTLPQYRDYYKWQMKMCSLNPVGTQATDFIFIDTENKRHRLYDIEAEYLVLIFGNPDCGACRDLMEAMSTIPEVVDLQLSGRLVVADIYIDEEIDAWKAGAAAYPPSWINGYDPSGIIRGDALYHVRAIPSIYLLDSKKTVLLKDVPQERLLDYLNSL